MCIHAHPHSLNTDTISLIEKKIFRIRKIINLYDLISWLSSRHMPFFVLTFIVLTWNYDYGEEISFICLCWREKKRKKNSTPGKYLNSESLVRDNFAVFIIHIANRAKHNATADIPCCFLMENQLSWRL